MQGSRATIPSSVSCEALTYRTTANGALELSGRFTGITITVIELNWWALMHDGHVDYDEFLSWKLEHPGDDYCGWEGGQKHWDNDSRYMLGDGSRPFQGEPRPIPG